MTTTGIGRSAAETGRFAPTSSGRAHPGTLLAGLLAWLDARSRRARFVLRVEDLDPERCTPALAVGLVEDLRWFGLDWDAQELQSAHAERHAAALDRLAAVGALYPSRLSRAEVQRLGRRAADGSWAVDGRERGTPLPADGWRACPHPLRAQLPPGRIVPLDDGGIDLAQDPGEAMGDPVVRRRDGAVSYHLAVVVDDAAAGVTRVIRGRDLAAASATQAALRRLLGLGDPIYRHHLLLTETHGGKLAKSHGSIDAPRLRQAGMPAEALCGFLAWCAGLADTPAPCTPPALLAGFAWTRVRTADVVIAWDGARLRRVEDAGAAPSPPPAPA